MKAWLLSNLFLKKMKIIRYEQQIKKKIQCIVTSLCQTLASIVLLMLTFSCEIFFIKGTCVVL